MVRSKSIVATPPGATIREQLVNRGMSQKEFATRMEMSEKHICNLLNGDVQLTFDMAVRLEMVLGVPAQFWSNLESIYRDKLVRIKIENEMEDDLMLSKKMPYSEMAKQGWVPKTTVARERVINLRKHFEVVKLSLIGDSRLNCIACRRMAGSEKADYALLAWAQRAKIEARSINTAPIDIKLLKKRIPDIRKMTVLKPSEFCNKLINLLSECGVALVFLPHIGGSFLHGATFYDGNKIVVGLTVRGKYADKFWFSLFHELAHIILGHIGQPNGTTQQNEDDADAFARETLIPSNQFDAFVKQNDYSIVVVRNFADRIGIDVGIVVGRLQCDGYIDYSWYNNMKTKYSLSA